MARTTGSSTPATVAKNKYNDKAYDRFYPSVKKGKRKAYEQAAKAGDFESLNAFVEATMDERAMELLEWTKERFDAEVEAAAEEARKEEREKK